MKTYLKTQHLLLTTVMSIGVMSAGAAHATNVLVNPGFEDNVASYNNGNNFPSSVVGWTFANGQGPNIVKVDGPNGYNYGNNGPESDADAATGAGVAQHYLDIRDGRNTFYQTFTPTCSGNVRFGGSFSTRGNAGARASISIRQGNGTTGTLVGQTNQITMPGGNSATRPWTDVNYTTALQAGTTYSFVVFMDNQANLDDAYVEFDNCPGDEAINTCCPPWTETKMGAALSPVPGPGGLFSNYGVSWTNVQANNDAMQAYANYLDVVNPAFNDLSGRMTVAAYGNGASPSSSGVSVPGAGQQGMNWTGSNGAIPTGTFWSGYPFQQDTWYGFTMTVIARDAQRQDLGLFEETCEPVTVYYRVQSMGGRNAMIVGGTSGFILQKSDGKKIISSEVLKARTAPKPNERTKRRFNRLQKMIKN